jgi:hypothetical protein
VACRIMPLTDASHASGGARFHGTRYRPPSRRSVL